MKRFIFALAFLAATTQAAQVTIDIPNEVSGDADAICSLVAAEQRLPDLTYQQCAQVMFNKILREYKQEVERKAAREAAESSFQATLGAAMATFDSFVVLPVVPTICGDSVVDTQYGEQCDDGNTDANDGCSPQCQLE